MSMGQTYKITVEITGRLDPVPGWGNKVVDHENFIRQILTDSSYIDKVDINSTEVYGSDHQTKMIEATMERHESGIWQMKEDYR